jgi:hypothetical protein
VKFRQEYTLMASLLDHSFKHENLICEILLLGEKASHAAIIILKRTDRGTFCMKLFDIEASFFQGLLKAFLFPIFGVIFWTCLWYSGNGFESGIIVSFWRCCAPPFNLFISNALSASCGKAAWADDWSKIKRAWQPGCASSDTGILFFTYSISCSQSYQASPLDPG